MPCFTLSKAALTHSLCVAALSGALLVPQAHGQMISGGPSQLRPSGSSVPVVAIGELPTTDFGRQVLNTDRQLSVTLGVRALPQSGPSGSSSGMSGFGGVTGDTTGVNALGKPKDAPSSIRLTGSHASDFLVAPAQCKFVPKGGIIKHDSNVFNCPVTFRASAEGPRMALLEALFSNGDRLQAVVKGSGQAATVAMPTPGDRGTGMQVQVGSKP